MIRDLEPPGTVFGKWTLIEHADTNRFKMRLASCRCECGYEDKVIMANLRTGKSRACIKCKERRVLAMSAKLSTGAVAEIRYQLGRGVTKASMMRRYGISRSQVNRIKLGTTWTGIEPNTDDF